MKIKIDEKNYASTSKENKDRICNDLLKVLLWMKDRGLTSIPHGVLRITIEYLEKDDP
ncbi:hypothetical protein LCGC14_1944950 [marine sediment metagenome]|uniref:Uncharacterized protein n=1 Tax=marine sediment metagenome TaxID=412755 RepID=A0A0F9FJG4_9ZZZZ